ncbi:MAG: hypothetical protein A2X02_04790 [Bacteroidetes bacterium GWF2_29_10]|nr:MAG: hypothetical protein A2X02_04790 [Bacteroidetes bacterium GWF2_29_10]
MLLNNTGFAQEGKYHKLLEVGRTWNQGLNYYIDCGGKFYVDTVFIDNIFNCHCIFGLSKIQCINDTLINNENYYKIKENERILLFREDTINHKVYVKKDSIDVNLFDYSLQLHDSVYFNYGYFANYYTFNTKDSIKGFVVMVDSINISPTETPDIRKRIVIDFDNQDYSMIQLIEGIGSNFGLSSFSSENNSRTNFLSGQHQLICVRQDGMEIFHHKAYSHLDCDFSNLWINDFCGTGIEELFANNHKMYYYDNQIMLKAPFVGKFEIYNLNGMLVKKEEIKSTNISMSELKAGLYVIRIFNDKSSYSFKFIVNY